MLFVFKGSSGAIMILLSSLASFVASTRLIRSAIDVSDSFDQSDCEGYARAGDRVLTHGIAEHAARDHVGSDSCLALSQIFYTSAGCHYHSLQLPAEHGDLVAYTKLN